MGTVDPKDHGVVLVVDDDDDYRQVVRDILERQRYFVLDAHDGGEALDVLRSEAARAIRLVILDLAMPGMSGWQLLEILRNDASLSSIPLLVTSAIPVHGDASGVGATTPWLGKPFAEDRLLAKVEHLSRSIAAYERRGPAALT